MQMNTVWILVCDAARARLFEIHDHDADPKWHAVSTFEHAASREKTSELTGDRMGQRSAEGAGAHHNALAPSSSPKETEKAHFGHTLAAMLDQAMRKKSFDRFVLVAPPHFLGMLKNELTPELHKHLLTTVDKDFMHLDVSELTDRLKDVVRIPPDQRTVIRETGKHTH
jgi:protein required for attachment to host cells